MSLFILRFLRCDARLPDGEQCETEWSTPTPQPTAADLRADCSASWAGAAPAPATTSAPTTPTLPTPVLASP